MSIKLFVVTSTSSKLINIEHKQKLFSHTTLQIVVNFTRTQTGVNKHAWLHYIHKFQRRILPDDFFQIIFTVIFSQTGEDQFYHK